MTRKITLMVNSSPVETDYFVERFLEHTVVGMVRSLEGVPEIHELNVSVEEGQTTVLVNGGSIPVNEFVNDLFSHTLRGMISTLKGVDEIRTLTIGIQR